MYTDMYIYKYTYIHIYVYVYIDNLIHIYIDILYIMYTCIYKGTSYPIRNDTIRNSCYYCKIIKIEKDPLPFYNVTVSGFRKVGLRSLLTSFKETL